MFVILPVYNTALESEDRIIQLEHIEEVLPHADVPVSPGPEDQSAVEVRFYSGVAIVVLLDMLTMRTRLQAVTGIIDTFGTLT